MTISITIASAARARAIATVLGLAVLSAWPSVSLAGAAAGKPAPVQQKNAKDARGKVLPAPIQSMLKHGKGVQVLASFPAEGGMTGYLMAAQGGERRIYYVPQNGKVALLGLMLDDDLNNLTARHLDDLGETKGMEPAVDAKDAAALAEKERKAAEAANLQRVLLLAAKAPGTWSEGRGLDVFVFYDPACPFCHGLYRESRAFTDKLRLHWIPVAVVSPDSPGLADAFLATADKKQGMEQLVARQLPPSRNISTQTSRVLQENHNLLNLAGSTRVPTLLFWDGQQTRRIIGKPDAGLLDAMSRLPAQADEQRTR